MRNEYRIPVGTLDAYGSYSHAPLFNHTCECCGEPYEASDKRSVYCSKPCQNVIANWHKRVLWMFRPFAALGFTLSWQSPKIFQVRLPFNVDYPVPDNFHFSSYYELGEVKRWNAEIVLHNTMYMERDCEAIQGLEKAIAFTLDKTVNARLLKWSDTIEGRGAIFWQKFSEFAGLPIEPRDCPDCQNPYVICDLWWETASTRNTRVCSQCALDQIPF